MSHKFLFKTFNKNAASLSVDPAMKTVLRDIMDTIDLHGSVLEDLMKNEEESEQVGSLFQFPPEEKDEVQTLLHQEVFGGVA